MQNFLIRFTDKKIRKRKGIDYVRGEIVINDFKEFFDIPLDFWTISDYERQWKEGLERIKTSDTSCLIIAICDPKKTGPYINWWPLYKEKNNIFIQNEVFFGDVYKKDFGDHEVTIDNCYNFIGPRIPEDFPLDLRPSEWVVKL
jgi:hypothetical protein